MIVTDTDILSDYLAGKGEAESVERLLRRGALKTTVISRFELLPGASNEKQLSRLLQLLDAVPSLRLTMLRLMLPVKFAGRWRKRARPSAWPTP
jgi:predicted nucleic acid-binding protein